ncbi:MAG: hypothetical protein HYV90_06000 [Candidatus Woesebacteria bacterium]|nr:MAG: hypothetical protein HYV90_06000 [Candidatus Woesebacteria bacterium]
MNKPFPFYLVMILMAIGAVIGSFVAFVTGATLVGESILTCWPGQSLACYILLDLLKFYIWGGFASGTVITLVILGILGKLPQAADQGNFSE